jgi:CheY-like chemotaxis protein
LDAAAKNTPFNVIGMVSGQPLAEQITLVESLNALDGLPSKRFVVACAGRDRSERKAVESTMYIDTDPMIRAKLIQTIAAAAGRISPDVSYEEEDAPVIVAEAPSVAEAEAMGQLVLFAEDNPTNQDVIGRQLNLLGYAYEVASDGKEALEMFQSKSYAILLTDCHMPNMDGFELAKSIRELETDKDDRFPIVAITASVMKEEIDSCYEAGMDDYLPKPLEMPKLKDMLRKRMPEPTGELAPAPKVDEAPESDVATVASKSNDGPIDPTALKSVFGDDEETFKEILAEFVEPATSNAGEIEAAFADRSAEGVARAAHKLKSSARSVGANDLADLCQALETAGNAESWKKIDTEAPRLAGILQEVTDYINGL